MHTLPPACLFAGKACLLATATLPWLPCCTPCHCLPACLLARLLPRLLNRLLPAPGYSAQATEHPATCLPAWPGYSAQATAHPADCLPARLLARLLPPDFLPALLGYCAQATLPRLLHTLPPACLPVCWPGYSRLLLCVCRLLQHPATDCLPAFCWQGCSAQATLPRLLHTLPPACLPVCCQAVCCTPCHQAACLPAFLLARLLCPGYCTPCHCLPACLLARLLCTPCNPVFPVMPGYSVQATAHPASCLPSCLLPRLLCPGYCTPCHLPACLFAGQATLPRLLHTLPTACLPVCWPGYSAQQTLPPDCLPACRVGQAVLPRLLCPGYCTPCHLPACLFAGQATLPRLLHTLPPAC